jgi:ABC-type branched-subunit amino acid transport system substrate-binding protein
MLNEDGGVNGRTINIVKVRDDTGDPNRNASEFQAAAEQDKAFMVFVAGQFGGSVFSESEKIPAIGPAYDSAWEKTHYGSAVPGGSWFDETPDDDPKTPANASTAYIASKTGATKVAGIGYSQAQSAQVAEDTCKNSEKYGLECVYVESSLPFGFTDLGASVKKIQDSGAEYIYMAMDITGCATIIRSLKRAGMNDLYYQCAVGYAQDSIDKFPDLIENMFIISANAPFEAASMKEFVTQLTARKPGVDPSTTTLNGWVAGILMKDALEEVGPKVTRDAFVKAIRAMTNFNAGGIIGGIDYSTSLESKYRDPNYKPDPKVCNLYVLRANLKTKKWAQVGELPAVCINGITDAASLKDKLAADKSSLEP